jgi:sialate O-acetylesterase
VLLQLQTARNTSPQLSSSLPIVGAPTLAERDADRQFWLDAAQASRAFFARTTHPVTGLNPDYAYFTGEPHPDYQGNTEHMDFRYDAWRTAMNWAVDYAWWAADENQKALSDHLLTFFYGQGLSSYGNLYTLDGTELGSGHSLGLVSTNAAAALAATDNPNAHAQEFVQALWDSEPQFGNYRYYDGLLQFISFLHVSGRFEIHFPAGGCSTSEQSCTGGTDDDCDGQTDCADSDCVADAACDSCENGVCGEVESSCSCLADCGAAPVSEALCSDGGDDDCDGLVDCADTDCSSDPLCQLAGGQLILAPIFGSRMVLQQGTGALVFGQAAPGASVAVEFQGQITVTAANASGNFKAALPALSASSTPSTLTVTSGPDVVTISDVQVGEVWLCSGQSNMGRALSTADGSGSYIADAGNHNLRFFRMHNDDLPAGAAWQTSTSATAADFSAVCYWMGLDLSQSLGVPVGLIQASYDGSAIEEWKHSGGSSGVHYDAMIRPLQPFSLKGVLWYQGESNGGEIDYEPKLLELLAEWRSDWARPQLPFGIVQLPAAKWKASRLAQYKVAQGDPNAFLVVTHDLPGSTQLHPTAKYEVGIRSSIGARATVYGEAIEAGGPTPLSTSSASGSNFIIRYADSGRGIFTTDGGAPGPFEIAGSNGRFVVATATIVGSTIVVSSSRVTAPVSVRYGYTGLGNVTSSVSIPVEGGGTVTSLPGSLFVFP